MSRFELVPIGLRAANAFVVANHRHHGSVRGAKFCLSAVVDGCVVGVVVVGRPVARLLDDGLTAEVTRCCVVDAPNCASFLYGAAARGARALGFRRLITYSLVSECGSSLRGAGWRRVGECGGGSWSRADRVRVDRAPIVLKVRWESL